MTENGLQLRCFGARGSVPVSGKGFDLYGGATSCYLVCFGNSRIFLDGGSGMVDPRINEFSTRDDDEIILVTHMHLDHIIGLPYHEGLKIKDHKIRIYLPDEICLSKLHNIYSPPYWPLSLTDYPADVSIEIAPEVIEMDGCRITHMMGNHPGGSLIFKMERNGYSIVYATDYEHDNGEKDAQLIEFSKGADVLVYDGSYTKEEYGIYRGYGHSTPERGAYVARQAGVKELIITHHAPDHDDAFVEQMERTLKEDFENSVFAYSGMVV